MQHQYSLVLIHHQVNNSLIEQRSSDGYINATELCKAAGKHWHNYYSLEQTGHFIRALKNKTQIPIAELIQEVKGQLGMATWIHPQVAINLAQWLSADFAVQVSEWVLEWKTNVSRKPTALPPHIARYIANDNKIPTGYFSMLQETILGLIGPLHNVGFEVPVGWVPDISVALAFCKWLRSEKKFDTNSLPVYMHDYQDGRPKVKAKLYPDSLLAEFRTWFKTVWLPVHGAQYFKRKDPSCMQYFDQLPSIAANQAQLKEPA